MLPSEGSILEQWVVEQLTRLTLFMSLGCPSPPFPNRSAVTLHGHQSEAANVRRNCAWALLRLLATGATCTLHGAATASASLHSGRPFVEASLLDGADNNLPPGSAAEVADRAKKVTRPAAFRPYTTAFTFRGSSS